MIELVGRAAEMAALTDHVGAGRRLVSIIGPAGVGKTSLLRAFVQTRDDSVLVDLVDTRSREDVLDALRARLGLDSTADPAGALAGRVLALDNFEQVCAEADLVADWLQRASDLVVVVATRERLRLRGEQLLELAPLAEDDAVALFLERASAVRPIDADPGLVAAIVNRLDRIPLAIELAAARMGLLGPEALLERLERRFDLLGGAVRTDSARQATLWGAIDWSWQLLDEAEQRALAQLSVFRGGLQPDAAEVVLDAGRAVLDLLQSLRDKSLLHVGEPEALPGRLRVTLLQAVRDFAAEQLEASGETEATSARHTTWALSLGDAHLPRVHGHDGVEARRRLLIERENLIAALERALAANEADNAHRLLLALEPVLSTRGPFDRYASLLDRTLALETAPSLRARVLSARGESHRRAGRGRDAIRDLEHAVERAREAADSGAEALATAHLGIAYHERGKRTEAKRHHERALELAQAIGDARREGRALGSLAILHHEEERLDTAQIHYERALMRVREAGDARSEGIFLSNLADLHHESRRHKEARRLYLRALELAGQAGDRRVEGVILGNLGAVLQEEGALAEARERRTEAITRLVDVGDARNEAVFRGLLGATWHEDGGLDEALSEYDRALESPALDPRYRGLFHAYRAAARAERGMDADARRDLDEALARLHPLGDPALLMSHSLHAAQLGGADAAREAAAGARGGDEPLSETSDEVRFALRLLERRFPELALQEAPTERATLRVAEAGRGFRAPGAEPVDISRRKTLRGILERLAEERAGRPGRGLSVEDLIEAGWPGERMLPEAGSNRVYVALATLRKLGLRAVLLNNDEGYLLDPEVALVRTGQNEL